MLMVESEEQSKNAYRASSSKPGGKTIEVSAEHPEKAELPIIFTLLGRVTDERL